MYPFNVRVYGLLIEEGQVLLVHEKIKGFEMTKFPGGELEFGEGIIECLLREFKEELDIQVEVQDHFYTTDFFQPSAFNKKDQIISIYYLVKRIDGSSLAIQENENVKAFEWMNIKNFDDKVLTFPIDKIVVKQLKSKGFD